MIQRRIQAVGRLPIDFDQIASFSKTLPVDNKRSVTCEIAVSAGMVSFVILTYQSTWDGELDVAYVMPVRPAENIENAGCLCDETLPAGYGYPATPEYEARQAKLKAYVDTIALSAFTDVLEQWHDWRLSLPDAQSS